jgi:hypothetical protein
MRLPTEPTVRVPRPPAPGPAKRAEPAVEPDSPPPVHPADETTAGLPRPAPVVRQRTIQFGKPTPVKVTVTARARRPHRTWPWIAAVALALLVLGVVLLVMLLRGETIDGDTDLVGSGAALAISAAPGAA